MRHKKKWKLLYIGYLKPAKWSHTKKIAYIHFYIEKERKDTKIDRSSATVTLYESPHRADSKQVHTLKMFQTKFRIEMRAREREWERKNESFKHFIIIFSTYFGAIQMTKPNKKPLNYGKQTYRFNHCLISQSQPCTLNFLRGKIIFTA